MLNKPIYELYRYPLPQVPPNPIFIYLFIFFNVKLSCNRKTWKHVPDKWLKNKIILESLIEDSKVIKQKNIKTFFLNFIYIPKGGEALIRYTPSISFLSVITSI